MRAFPFAAGLVLAVSVVIAANGQAPAGGLYTPAQADAGEVLYDEQCVSCHGTLSAFFPEMAALLGDHTFRQRWEGRSIGELFQLIQEEMGGFFGPDFAAALLMEAEARAGLSEEIVAILDQYGC